MEASRAFTILLLLLLKSILLFGQQGQWTWMKGDTTLSSAGHYGIQGVADSANSPAAVYEANNWTDQQGNFWLYGGLGPNGAYSDLWKYNVSNNLWTWVKGPGLQNQPAVYGLQGIPSVINTPGGRGWGFVTWVDLQGDLWLFGGQNINGNHFNDLWRYHISTHEWTWMKGSSLINDTGYYGTKGIPGMINNPPARWEVRCGWTADDGTLWLFGGALSPFDHFDDVWKYDITTNQWTWMHGDSTPNQPVVYGIQYLPAPQNTPGSRDAYAHWKDPDGDFWLFDGNNRNDLWKFDPQNLEWTWISGNHAPACNGICQSSVNNIPAARFENSACWNGNCDFFYLFGGRNFSTSVWGDLWAFNRSNNEWTFMKGSLTPNTNGHHGNITVPGAGNFPCALNGSCSWTDQNGNLWLFGGLTHNGAPINELWRYTTDTLCPPSNYISTVSISPDTVICAGDSIILSVSGGATYLWSPVSDINDPSSPNPIIYPDSSTTYSVIITRGSCHITRYVHVTVSNDSSFKLLTQDTLICRGDSVVLQATGGSTYHWLPATNINNQDIPNPVVYPHNTTIYSVSISEGPCQKTLAVHVYVNTDSLFALLTHDTTICPGDSLLLQAAGGNTYHWTPSANMSNPFIPDPIVYPDSSTLYSVSISNGPCQKSFFVHVYVNADSVFSLLNHDTLICKGDSISFLATGGNTYHWQPSYHLSDPDIPNPSACPDISTIYSVTISNDCFNRTFPVHVQVIHDTSMILINHDTIVCQGQAVQLTATGGVQYSWNSGQSTRIITVNPLVPTEYFVTITDIYGCHTSDSVMIHVNTLPVIKVASSEPSICQGLSVQLSASGAILYHWYPQDGLSGSSGNPVLATPSQTMIYTVTGTDQNGCSDTATVKVEVINCPPTIPNVFTPNADGKNDYFVVLYDGGFPYNIKIYNRWGIKLFESNDLRSPWDGRYKETTSPAERIIIW